jgi:hypothetical protein
LQWLEHIKIMHRARILMRALEIKFKGWRLMRQSIVRWFDWILEDVKKRGKSWQEIKKHKL